MLSGLGYRPRLVPSGGGSDVNALLRNGFPAVNLCNGMIDIHTADERIAIDSLDADDRRDPRPDRRRPPLLVTERSGALGPPIRSEVIYEGRIVYLRASATAVPTGRSSTAR